jgi:3-dehydroquinate synthase
MGNVFLGSIREGLANELNDLQPTSVILLADDNTVVKCLPYLKELLPDSKVITVPHGEQSKNLDSCIRIWTELIQLNSDREAVLINTGGGLICDLGGFAASCYQRGIRFVNMPTSLLSMADAAIGGKTGVDFAGYKNYIGSIVAPAFTWIDPAFLKTLPLRETKSGLAEVIKHAIIGSPELWDMLEGSTAIEDMPWEEILKKNLPVKLNIIESDPFEKGIRKVLNFGHTIGHALESYYLTTSHPALHGVCVSLGMMVESKMANIIGILEKPVLEEIVTMMKRVIEPLDYHLPEYESLARWLKQDKKNRAGQILFSLPDRIGSCGWNLAANEEVIQESYEWLVQGVTADGRLNLLR